MCGFPKLIAACHVLHRLFLPRHPPCALSSLTIEFTPAQRTYRHLKPSMLHRLGNISVATYLKTLLCMISLLAPRLPKQTKAAQPCSYIYPIYAVVKHRVAIAYSIASHPEVRLSSRPKLRSRIADTERRACLMYFPVERCKKWWS